MTAVAATRPQLAHLTAQLDALKQNGSYFRLRELEDIQGPVCTYDGRKVINLASNNYLGLCNHPKLEEAAIQAIRKHGVGSGAVRTIAGTMRIHMELEEKIAAFKNVEACVVFQSGFTANAGTVGSILGKEDFILSDELNHALTVPASPAPRSRSSATRTSPTAKRSSRRSRTNLARSSSSPMASSRWTGTSAPSANWPRLPRSTTPS
jgi:glycine C-acetyltransferase